MRNPLLGHSDVRNRMSGFLAATPKPSRAEPAIVTSGKVPPPAVKAGGIFYHQLPNRASRTSHSSVCNAEFLYDS